MVLIRVEFSLISKNQSLNSNIIVIDYTGQCLKLFSKGMHDLAVIVNTICQFSKYFVNGFVSCSSCCTFS